MSTDHDDHTAATCRRLAEAHPDEFRNLVFQEGVALAGQLLEAGDRLPEAQAMVARIEAAYVDMAEASPNEWIRRVAAERLAELRATRAERA